MSLQVKPSRGLEGRVAVPGDKSISHRAAILGALGEGITRIDGFLESEDCLATLRCLSLLGVPIHRLSPGCYTIVGQGSKGFQEPMDVLDCGNSGTTMRLLAGALSMQPIFSILTGDASLRNRPMARIIEPLRSMGGQIYSRKNNTRAPLAIIGNQNLEGKTHVLPIASAQVKSAILLAGLGARGATVVREPARSRNHTEVMLQQLGVPVKVDGLSVTIEGGTIPRGGHIIIPGDISSAAYLLVAGAILPDSDLTITNVGVNPTRAGIISVLQKMGADLSIKPEEGDGEKRATIRVRSSHLKGTEIGGEIIPTLIDELPVIAVAAAYAQGMTRVKDAAELRVKECDRIAVVAKELAKLGVDIEAQADGWIIQGGQHLRGGVVSGHNDHRVVMALAILGLGSSEPLQITGAQCLEVSFPGFAGTFQQLGAEMEETAKDPESME
ncbi:MAG: 3-phosphoshikimate 1-carboxyvinyltransferase [Firmicutes bacterium]|jgi:3-phosphoshikimate 1-carboxyvinyltransferase|nr:3-phosphoshikimate 1-carboxyvinyltransferase [Bacillota bacterium]